MNPGAYNCITPSCKGPPLINDTILVMKMNSIVTFTVASLMFNRRIMDMYHCSFISGRRSRTRNFLFYFDSVKQLNVTGP